MVVHCCVVVANELQAKFIYEHVEGAKAVAGTRVGSVGIHDYVGVVHSPNKELHEEPEWPAVVASRLVQACNLVVLVLGFHVPATRGKVRVSGSRTLMQNCVKKAGSSLAWCSQLQAVEQSTVRACPHTPVHSGCSPRVVVVAQEVDGLAVLPDDGTETSPAPEFVQVTFGQPLAEFLGIVFVA